nr:aminoacyl-histidine dipeptidase [Clostridia bacterium]
LNDFKPVELFHFFEDIARIPHGSGNEEGIALYLEKFAEDRGLMHWRDETNNVLIKKQATPGYEFCPAILFQAHTDMVCEKNASTVHDFEKDPLKLKLDGKFLYAEGTTLGGDDGIGVALCLAVLNDNTLAHPDIECLFTASEETGLVGAGTFDYSLISARRMVNLDTGDDDVILSSCAGGMRTDLTLEYETFDAPPLKSLSIQVTGLKGGHSGAEIHLGLANANRILGRILNNLYREEPFQLISLSGGLKTNAIPREACAQITVSDPDAVTADIKRLECIISNELCEADSKFRVTVKKGKAYDRVLSFADTAKAIALMTVTPNGVLSMSPRLPELVEASTNLGVIAQNENSLMFSFENRSSSDSKMDDIIITLETLAKHLDVKFSHSNRYPGWEFISNSQLREDYIRAYEDNFGTKPRVTAVHAGLECGLIKDKIPEMDIISVGPNQYSIHTPSERLDLRSCERVWKVIERLLEMKPGDADRE